MNTGISIADGYPAQFQVLSALHARCFEDAWSPQAMGEVLQLAGAFSVVAVAEAPVGFALARLAADEAELLTLCVLPNYRRRGIAARLLAACMEGARARGAKAIFLEVDETNDAAHALYTMRGFVGVGRRPDYYRLPNRVPSAALILRASLAKS